VPASEAGTTQAAVLPQVMHGSVRVFGIGGLGAVGTFHNAQLGTYRAYATNGENTVVLGFGDRTVVVSPDAPDAFAAAVRAQWRA
jgi:hypothetical protein